jgi:hypothetical protein
LLLLAGILILAAPLYLISPWTLIIQGFIAIKVFQSAAGLFAAWDDKKRKIAVLLGKNKKEFRAETFRPFMQAPCSRLVVKYVLKEIGREDTYKELMKMKRPFIQSMKENCRPVKTVIYVNEEFL